MIVCSLYFDSLMLYRNWFETEACLRMSPLKWHMISSYILSVVLAGRVDSARPRGTQGMKRLWTIGL